ncbi:hypothetical protein B0H14DRAFT_3472027 [Mycena olivaceomarginata]|nr:hypothetical protein B0H14DRAFT_3472027 [Mycena olivaceomarginata]
MLFLSEAVYIRLGTLPRRAYINLNFDFGCVGQAQEYGLIKPGEWLSQYRTPNDLSEFRVQSSIHTSIENLRPLDTEPCDNHCDIPLDYDNQVTIGVYMRLGDAGGGARKGNQAVDILEAQYRHPTTTLGPAKITIVTEFPADIGLTLPLPRDPRVDAALAATIRGEDIVDVEVLHDCSCQRCALRDGTAAAGHSVYGVIHENIPM